MTPSEQYANNYLADYNLNDPASEADLWIIAKEAYQAGRDSKVTKLKAMRDDDFKLIQSLQKQIDEATKEYQTLYNNYAEHDRKLNDLLAIHDSDLQQIKHYTTNYERKCKEYAGLFAQYSALKKEKQELQLKLSEFKRLFSDNGEVVED